MISDENKNNLMQLFEQAKLHNENKAQLEAQKKQEQAVNQNVQQVNL
jgi:hypothetical protein